MHVYTLMERDLIRALEMIATGRSSEGPKTDVEVMRQIAKQALDKIGWPTDAATSR